MRPGTLSSDTAVGDEGRYERQQIGKTILFRPASTDLVAATA